MSLRLIAGPCVIENRDLVLRIAEQAGLIQSVSQVPWPGLSAWVEVGEIAPFPCPKSRFPQPIST